MTPDLIRKAIAYDASEALKGEHAMKIRMPDLEADIVAGVSAAGFSIGELYSDVRNALGPVSVYGPDAQVGDAAFEANTGWIEKQIELFDKRISSALFYRNRVIELAFGGNGVLYQIVVGAGYQHNALGIDFGESIQSARQKVDLEFNEFEDIYNVPIGDDYLPGLAFATDYTVSTDIEPNQTIERIVIFDFSLVRQDVSEDVGT